MYQRGDEMALFHCALSLFDSYPHLVPMSLSTHVSLIKSRSLKMTWSLFQVLTLSFIFHYSLFNYASIIHMIWNKLHSTGAHTIGIGHCSAFINRLYNFSSTSSIDPSLNPQFAQILQRLCPQGNPNPNTEVNMDPRSPRIFDNAYYTNLRSGQGLFTSDQTLFIDPTTRRAVLALSANNANFRRKFVQSMIKMSSINVKTGSQGQIRNNCRLVNSS